MEKSPCSALPWNRTLPTRNLVTLNLSVVMHIWNPRVLIDRIALLKRPRQNYFAEMEGTRPHFLSAFCTASLSITVRLHVIIYSQALFLLPIYFKCNPSSTFKVSQPSHGQSFRSLCPDDGIVDCIFSLFVE